MSDTVLTALFEGSAKPSPILPPVGVVIQLLIPISSPLRLTRGPPEFP